MRSKVIVARIGAAHGVRGEVKLWPFTQDPLAVASYGPLETKDGSRRFDIEIVRPSKDHLIARIEGVSDRDAAQALRNIDLYVSREKLPAIEEDDTYYHSDLIGLAAMRDDGTQLGTVHAIHNFGAGDLIEITPLGTSDTMMLPFTDATVPKIDLEAKQIVVVPPAEVEVKENEE